MGGRGGRAHTAARRTTDGPARSGRGRPAAGDDDIGTLIACFTEDGQVTDEGETYRGPDEIRAWRERLASAYEYTVEVLDTQKAPDGTYRVRTNVEGNFPGGQVELAYDFRLRGDLISELVIAP